VRRLGDEIPLIQERMANLKLDIAQRKNTGGDSFVIQINGNTINDRVKAGEAINLLAAQIAGSGCEKQAGEFAGFRLILRAGFLDRVDVVLKGKNTYSVNLSDSGLGTIRSMEYVIQNLDECQQRYARELAESEKHKRELESKIGQPFEYDEKLQSLSLRQQEIVKALDITRNQAASDLDAANPSEQESISVAVAPGENTRRSVSVRV
jgi:hypothetical protein